MAGSHVALVVDNDDEVLQELRGMLASLGHRCVCATTQEEAQRLLDKQALCYVLLDLELPVRSNHLPKVQVGFNLLEQIRARFSKEELPVIVMTGHGEGHQYPTRAFKMGADDYVKKPFDSECQPLEDKIREAMRKTCERAHSSCPHVANGTATQQRAGGSPNGQSGRHSHYGTTHKFHFSGECRNRRYLIRLDDKELWIPLGSFSSLWKLAVRVLDGSGGWIHQDEFESARIAIHRLKRELSSVLGSDAHYIESDGHGSYRLSVPRQNISFNEQALKAHHPALYQEHKPAHQE